MRATSDLAIVMTVRDESRFLRKNLLYHSLLGVSGFYLYDDGCTDDTVESVSDLPNVSWTVSVPVDAVELTTDLAAAASHHDSFFVGRQLLNTQHAMARARADGYRWLIFIDADELIAVDRSTAVPGALKSLMDTQAKTVEAVIFPVFEALQRKLSYTDVFTEETLFKVADSGRRREILGPMQGRKHRIDVMYGHKAGKMAVRLDVDAVPWSSHRFRAPGGRKLRSVEIGYLLHYYAPDFASFVHKFRVMKTHPDKHLDGRSVVLQKRLWRDVVNHSGLTEDQLRDYFESWVMFDDKQIQRLRSRRGYVRRRKAALVEVTSAAEALRGIESKDPVLSKRRS